MGFEHELTYKYGSQAKYDAYLEYNSETLYWCTDTRKLYRGSEDYTEAVRFVPDHATLLTPARGVLYIEPSGAGWVYVKDAETETDTWKPVFQGGNDAESGITIVTTIDEESTDEVVPSAKAVYDLFKTIETPDLSDYALKSDIKNIASQAEYEVFDKPVGTLVDYRDKEIRILCPSTTEWVLRPSGETADQSKYYLGFKAYAPSSDVVSFKESMDTTITDDTMYYFEDNDFAGIDAYGRKFSTIWLPVATYDLSTDTWTYHGAVSTEENYRGWYYRVDWYNASGVVIASDLIRINLSNEDCHYAISDAVLTDFVTEDEMNTLSEKVTNLENHIISATTWHEMV